jgi:hypothetical protein
MAASGTGTVARLENHRDQESRIGTRNFFRINAVTAGASEGFAHLDGE